MTVVKMLSPFYARIKGWKTVRVCEIVIVYSIHLPDGFSSS